MKKLIILIVIFILSCNSKEDETYDDLLKIRKGMRLGRVDSIMRNKPREIKSAFWDNSLFVQYYDSGVGASDDFKIILSKKDSLVVDIEYGD